VSKSRLLRSPIFKAESPASIDLEFFLIMEKSKWILEGRRSLSLESAQSTKDIVKSSAHPERMNEGG